MWDPEGGGSGDPGGDADLLCEEEELKDQFQQQRDKIEELKVFLKKNEEKMMSGEKEAEKYATKLSRIKFRSKASKRKSTTPIQDSLEARTPDHEVETPIKEETSTPRRSGAKKAQGNLVLLRKQLEENRAKFELRGKEVSENRKGIEEMVQHLKNQLDERDVKIKELQKHLDTQQPMEFAKEGNASTEEGDVQQDVYAQIVQKDNKIIELNTKIADLESKVLDLQESFSEKDSVIAARTKAITLMSEDFSKRSKTTVDNLEETREEMRKMQATFVLEEGKMKEELEELKKELASKNQKLHQIEENNKDLLTVRFDLSARNAELQEKVVKTHEKNLELQKQINVLEETVSASAETKQDVAIQENLKRQLEETNALKENLQKQLDEANQQMSKMKAQHKTKIRSLTKQLDGLKKMSDASEEILKLQNKIAELEEDKGNLQLHLVDFDELKVSESHWKTRISELEERISQQNQDLDTHVHMIALLEEEKLNFIKEIQEGREKEISLKEEIKELKSSAQQLENLKLTLEMKTVDLEEQIDIINKEKKELQEELEAKSRLNNTEEKHVYEENSEKQNIADVGTSSHGVVFETEQQEEGKELEKSGFTIGNETLNRLDLEVELENSRKVIEEQKTIIMDLNLKIDSRDEELDLQQEMIMKLEQLNSEEEKEDKITNIIKELNEMASDLEEWKKRCTEVEKRLQDLGIEKDELEVRFNEVKTENSILKQRLEDQQELAANLTAKLKDNSNAITSRDEKISVLQSMIELNGQTLEAREMTLKDVHEKLNTVEKQFENKLSELKSLLHIKEKEIVEMATSLTKRDDLLNERDEQIKELNDVLKKERQELESLRQHASNVENSARQLQDQLADLSKTTTEKDLVISQMTQDYQHHKGEIEELSSELSNKIEHIKKIEMEMNCLRELETQLKVSEANVKSQDEELNKLKMKLELMESELGEKVEKLNETEKKVTELTEKNKKYIANLKARTLTVKGHEQKLHQYDIVLKEKENLILELTATKEKLVEELTDKQKLDSKEIQDHRKVVDGLTKELQEEQTRTELISEELTRATEKIVTLERDLKNSESKAQEIFALEENRVIMLNKITELEKEISQFQTEVKSRDEELNYLKEENSRLNDHEKEVTSILKEDRVKHAQLITSLEEKITILEAGLIARKNELDEFRNVISDKDFRIDQLNEQMMEISERGSQSLSANEAKLQEREAVVEFLEQEVSKSKEIIQHLEERLAFVEERRLSVEKKAEALGLRAQESDRMKEEAIETEGMLEKQFEMLLASEESLKKKLGLVTAENEELSQKVAELTTQNIESKREMQNVECRVKDLLQEVERLTPFEFSFGQASEKIETLQLELKRVTSEFEYRMAEKIHNLQQQSDSLESDLKNVSMELEKIESEKRTLLEKYEKLNDDKLNLEDEIERQNEIILSYKSANESLKEKFTNDEMKNKLEEKIELLEVELQNKASLLEDKEILNKEQIEKIQILENEQKERAITIETLLSSKDELNERFEQLQIVLNDRETVILEKDKLLAEIQEKIMFFESKSMETMVDVGSSETEELIAQLNKELDHLKSVILQKDREIKNYQTHMLQLQFETVSFSPEVSTRPVFDQVSQLEETKSKLEEVIKTRETQISDMNSVLNLSNVELEELRSQHTEDKCKIEMLDKELERLREEIMNRDNYIQELQIAKASCHFPDEIDLLRDEYESQLSNLQQQKEMMYKELLQMKAEQEVSDIVHVAEDHVQRITATSEGMDFKDSPKKKSVTFQQNIHEHSVSVDCAGEHSEVIIQLENKITSLQEELQLVKSERDEALLRLSQLTTNPLESMPSDETDNIILMMGNEIQVGSTSEDQTSISKSEDTRNQMLDSTISLQQVPLSRTQNWEMNEEEGWWGSDEARLEEEHIQKQQHTLSFSEPADVLNKRVAELENHIKDLEDQREKLSEELHNSQVRSGKMLKKMKELKLKNDSLLKENMELTKKKSENVFSNLDQAIEEELKIQIDTLEKEVKELTSERDSMRAEKEGLLKRIDILTSANEKLVESKERQDIDLELWKQKNKDLNNRVHSLEWRISELEENNTVSFDTQGEKMEENTFFSWDKQGLNTGSEDFFVNTNNDKHGGQAVSSSDDNQVLLEKEKSLRLTAENHVQDLKKQLIDVNAEIEQLAVENSDLKNQLEQLIQQQTNNDLQSAYSVLSEKYDNLCKETEEFKIASETKCETLRDEYNRKVDDLTNKNLELDKLYKSLQCDYDRLSEELDKFNALSVQNSALQSDFDNLKEHTLMQEKALAFAEEKLRSVQELPEKDSSDDTTEMLSEQHMKIIQLEKEFRVRDEEVEKLRQLNENQKLEHARVEQEWNNKMERIRKELKLSAETLLQYQNRYLMLEKEHEGLKDHMNKVIENQIHDAISIKQQEIDNLKTELEKKESCFESQRLKDFENIEHKLAESLEILNIRENDIKNLTKTLSEKEMEFNDTLSIKDSDIQNFKIQALDNERKLSELLGQKDQDIQNLNIQLSEKDLKISELEESLNEEKRQCIELQRILGSYEAQLQQSRDVVGITNSQNIPTLSSSSSIQHHDVSTSDKVSVYSLQDGEDRPSDPQQELDLALYMLHQRDVRCDELTLELMQLLEERDTLQLRLSNALRMNEELRNLTRTSSESSPVKIIMSQSSGKDFDNTSREESPQHTGSADTVQTSTTSAEVEEDLQSLANKLSELRRVGYHRDVTLQDERQQRHSEQVRLLHQRGSGIVVDASYTLSRDVQSPSTVLLNWIWGRSTPRVMHI